MSKASEAGKVNRVLMSGNDAVVEGAIRAGIDCYFGYPITPQNEIPAAMSARLRRWDACSCNRRANWRQ